MPRWPRSAAACADELLGWFEARGNEDYVGEGISQARHAAQCAQLAERAGADETLILAALLHDIGHLMGSSDTEHMGSFGVARHERAGARYLASLGCSARLCELVEGHVAAKRYLVATRPAYAARLSAASTATLVYQGGAMTPAEVAAFDASPLRDDVLRLRAWDEAAKDPAAAAPPPSAWRNRLAVWLEAQRVHPATVQVDKQLWQQQGWLHVPGFVPADEIARLQAWCAMLADWPESRRRWMQYFEYPPDGGRQLCRVEDFLPWHQGLAELVAGAPLTGLVADLVGDPVRLYKEKINYKLPGGAGFTAHQDAPAFARHGAHYHVTAMLAVDAATCANGTLEVARHPGVGVSLPNAPDLAMSAEAERALDWQAIELAPGDVLLFDSWLPHRSAANRTDEPRRALYLTFNRTRDGNHRLQYFADKRAAFPPEAAREAGRDYAASAVGFNVGNPIR